MEQFFGYALGGLPQGCIYAIVGVSLVLTFQATGVLNFAFGAQAFISAFIYTFLTEFHGWPGYLAFLVSVVALGPLVGLAFDRFMFRRIPNSNTTAKMVISISMLVGLPQLVQVIFGPQNLDSTVPIIPWFDPNRVYFLLAGTPINGIFVSTVSVMLILLVALTALLRYTSLGLQMRGAVESRRLVELDGVNGNGVVGAAWMISSFMASFAGVLLAPIYGNINIDYFSTLTVAAIAAAAWAMLRSIPIAAGVAVLIGVATTAIQGYISPNSLFNSAIVNTMPFIVLMAALLLRPGMRRLDESRDPLATIDPPPPPIAAVARVPSMDRIIKRLWWALLATFIVSMLTWIPKVWENVFNSGLALAVVLLSITLITGMAGQLSLSQGTLAGVGAFTAAQLAQHLGLNMLVGGLVGAALAAVVAVVLALLSLRLRGLGLALMTLAAAVMFDATFFNETSISGGGQGVSLQASWLGFLEKNDSGVTISAFFNSNGHAFFILAMVVLSACVGLVLLVRKGTVGRNLAAMRGSETAAAGLGINLTSQRIAVFALAGAIAGIGGALVTIQQQTANANAWNYQLSLVFIVLVVTTGVSTVEGAIQGAFGYYVTQYLLTYGASQGWLPSRFGGNGLVIVLFAFGSLQFAKHPEGILEFQKRRGSAGWERRFFPDEYFKAHPDELVPAVNG